MFFSLDETKLGLELASQSYQWILQAQSHTIDLLSIQIDKYEKIETIIAKQIKFVEQLNLYTL